MSIDFEAAFRQSPSPCMILNKSLEFAAANPAYLDMIGKSWEDLEGRFIFDVFPEAEDRVQQMTEIFVDSLGGENITMSEIPFRIDVGGVIKEQWWTAYHARLGAGPVSAYDDNVGGGDSDAYLIQFSENVTSERKMRDLHETMISEMQHRVGNLFAMIMAIARRTATAAPDIPTFISGFEARIQALLAVNRILTGDDVVDEDLGAVAQTQVSALAAEAADRIVIDGPAYPLSLMQSQAVSMALHELVANSVKHGAIGREDGAVSITWSIVADKGCRLVWKETGILASEARGKAGYGTMLLDTIIPNQLDGSASRVFAADGLTYSLEIGGGG